MKQLLHFSVLSLLFLAVIACSHETKVVPRDIASLQASGVEGIWFLQGSSSTRGPYNGELEFRKSNDGTYDVVRVATYINSYFEGLKVQEVWIGKAVPTEENLTISFDLKQGDYVTALDKNRRAESDFRNNVTLVVQFTPKDRGLQAQFSDKKASKYSEWLTTKRNLESEPLWKDLRAKRDAAEKPNPPAVAAAIKNFKKKIGYDKDPLVNSYKEKPEFKTETPYVISDVTDFEFYRKNKDIIRVVNKVTDDISIAEAAVKRNAYSPSLLEKQRGYEGNTKDHHLNELGMVSYARVDEKGRFLGFIPDVDSALWTGMYVGSQSMRYLATLDKEALFNVRKSLKGLLTLLEVTGDSAVFARTVATSIPGAPLPEGWKAGEGNYAQIIWLDGGNSDMLQGVLHGLTWAYLVLPETERDLLNQIRAAVPKLLSLKEVQSNPRNRAQAQGLISLFLDSSNAKDEFRSYYSATTSSSVKKPGPFEGPFYYRGNADWNGVNTNMVTSINEILLAEKLEEDQLRSKLREQLLDQWVTYKLADRHALTLAAQAFSYRWGTRSPLFKTEAGDSQFTESLDRAKWGMREIPFPRPNLNIAIDHSLAPGWSMSPVPKEFWKPLKTPSPPTSYFYQGLYNYPIYEFQAFSSNFVWKDSAFTYETANLKDLEKSGVDYLYAYWMARYGGVIGATDAD